MYTFLLAQKIKEKGGKKERKEKIIISGSKNGEY